MTAQGQSKVSTIQDLRWTTLNYVGCWFRTGRKVRKGRKRLWTELPRWYCQSSWRLRSLENLRIFWAGTGKRWKVASSHQFSKWRFMWRCLQADHNKLGSTQTSTQASLAVFLTLCTVCFLRLPSCFYSVMESADSRKMSSTYCRTFALAKLAKPEDFAEVIALVIFEEFTKSFVTLIGPAIPSNPSSVPICVKVRGVDGRVCQFQNSSALTI